MWEIKKKRIASIKKETVVQVFQKELPETIKNIALWKKILKRGL